MTDQAAAASAVPTGPLLVRAVLRTDVGLVRSENQDFGTLTTSAEERRSSIGGRLLVVADGMGGHRGGATASRLAGETVKALFLQNKSKDIPVALRESLSRANARIFAEAQTNPDLRGMGTTTSALAIQGNQGWFAHVGDSRIYMVRSGEIRQLTDDHSLVATMVREGLLTSKEAETHPRRNVLQRSMGVAEDVEIDVRGPIEIKEGDTFILCSDGLHGLVKEEELKDVAAKPLVEAADQFVKLALERGAPDNVTVIVARVEKKSETGEDTLIEEEEAQLEPDPGMFDETIREPGRAAELLVDPNASTLPQTAPLPASAANPADLGASAGVPTKTAPGVRTPSASGVQPVPDFVPEIDAPEPAKPSRQQISDDATVRVKQPAAPPPTTAYAMAMASAAAAEESLDATAPASPALPPQTQLEKDDDTLKTKRRPAADISADAPRGSSILKWMLLAVVALGAAGALLFMNREQGRNSTTPSQTAPSR